MVDRCSKGSVRSLPERSSFQTLAMPSLPQVTRRSANSPSAAPPSSVEWLLPSHGPYFRKDPAMINRVIERLNGYLHLSDFGTCAIDWPLMKQWEQEIAEGRYPES